MPTQKVLTMASAVSCGHEPGHVAVSSDVKLQVAGQSVLLENGISGQAVTVCFTKDAQDTSGTPIALTCKKVSAITSGRATKIKVNGKPLILETLGGDTDGMVSKITPQKMLHATAKQDKLKAV